MYIHIKIISAIFTDNYMKYCKSNIFGEYFMTIWLVRPFCPNSIHLVATLSPYHDFYQNPIFGNIFT